MEKDQQAARVPAEEKADVAANKVRGKDKGKEEEEAATRGKAAVAGPAADKAAVRAKATIRGLIRSHPDQSQLMR
jgi:hypothetical protein